MTADVGIVGALQFDIEVLKSSEFEKVKDDWTHYGYMSEAEVRWNGLYDPQFDDTRGVKLDPVLAKQAEHEEVTLLTEMKVYEYVLRGEAQRNSNGELIGF